jgi:hypothetical protein
LSGGAHSFVSTEALGEAELDRKPCASRHEMSPCKSHVNEPWGGGCWAQGSCVFALMGKQHQGPLAGDGWVGLVS